MRYIYFILGMLILGCSGSDYVDTSPRPLQILFLGHDSKHHNSYEFAPMLMKEWTKEGIHLTYTEDPDDLNEETLSLYDGLMVYANYDTISTSQEEALLNFVREGKGFIPVHSASYCFRNSGEVVDLIGGQFMSHETDTFSAEIIDPDHPVMEGVKPFTVWDETYVHDKIADDIYVLMERVEGDHREPYTWVKEYGKGRVFYTAHGHDERSWEDPEYQKLLKNGLLWAVGERVRNMWEEYHDALPEFVYRKEDNIPNYEKRDPWPQYQEPFTPEESQKFIQVPAGFKLELFASEPDIINPVSMAWDERGRLWVVETVDYPNTIRDERVGSDRIKICEDTNGDGKADKFTVFADGLNIPTSIMFVDGGVLISQAPDFIFLKDTDGDDVADVKEVVMEGWGTFDTHAGPSNLQYGLDNKIWGVVGYSGFEGEIGLDSFRFRQGLYRFDPDYRNFEIMGNTSNNTWGLGFTETNQVFASTANNTHSVFMGIPSRYYEGLKGLRNRGSIKIDGHYPMHPVTDKVRQVDVFGGFTAASGHYFYTARDYPDKYWNNHAMVAEPTGHLVHWAKIVREGAGFVEKDGGNLIAGADEWFAPVEAKVGPDGNVWVADWYNFIVQHNPTPTPDFGGYSAETGAGNAHINPLRDREHGRIWRIVPKNKKKEEALTLKKEEPEKLVNTLSHPNMFWRLTAQRLLVERGEEDVEEELVRLLESEELDEIGNAPGALHALWTMEGLGVFEREAEETYGYLKKALAHSAPAVRKGAIQILTELPSGTRYLREGVVWEDSDPEVQLAALLSVASWVPSETMGEVVYELSRQKEMTEDRWLSQALYMAAARHQRGFLKGYAEEYGTYQAVRTEDERSLSWDQRFLNHYWDESSAEILTDPSGPVSGQAQKIRIGVIQNEMKYDIADFVVEAGKPVELTFVNEDFMQHNLLICAPGSMEKVGEAADEMAMAPEGTEKQYIPDMPEVLHSTKLLDPEERTVLRFTAPEEPGDYPFVCTFPGHWRLMNGIMKVKSGGAL